MRPYALLFIYIATWQASAASLEEDYVRRLSRAQSAEDIRRATGDFEKLKVARSACRLQVRRARFPAACYEALELEIRSGLHPRPGVRRKLIGRLDEICAETAAALKIPRGPGGDAGISPQCRRNLARAREIQNYRERRPDWSEN